MAYAAQVYEVVVASPSDLQKDRKKVRDAIFDWNAEHSKSMGIIFQPVMWEFDTVPEVGVRPQESINKQIIYKSDIMIAMFWSKLGSPTGEAISGTVEEIGHFLTGKKPIALYFSDRSVSPSDVDPKQLDALKSYKDSIKKESYFDSFKSHTELSKKVGKYLNSVSKELNKGKNIPVLNGDSREQDSYNTLQTPTNFSIMLNQAKYANANGYWISIVADYRKGFENFNSAAKNYLIHWTEDIFHTIFDYDGLKKDFGERNAVITFPNDDHAPPLFRVHYSNEGLVMIQWRADSWFIPLEWVITMCLVSVIQIVNSPIVAGTNLSHLGISLSNSPEGGISTTGLFESSKSDKYLKSLNSSWESTKFLNDIDRVIKEFVRVTLSAWGYYDFEEGLDRLIIKQVKQEFLLRQRGISL